MDYRPRDGRTRDYRRRDNRTTKYLQDQDYWSGNYRPRDGRTREYGTWDNKTRNNWRGEMQDYKREK
jgi:hypothetical protein